MKLTLQMLCLAGSLTVVLSAAMTARADGPDHPRFSISGFGTVGAAHSSEKKADYTSTIFKPNGAGHTRDWSFDVDSRLGLQMDVNFTPQLSAVLQVIAEQRYDNSYKPTVEWANVKYRVTPDFSVRVGRIALAGFIASDYRKVGYAIPWLRPPGDLYGLSQLTSSDGIDVNYRFRAGELTNTLHSYYGNRNIRTTYNRGAVSEFRDMFGITHTMDYGAASFRYGYYQGRLSMDAISPFFDAFRRFGPRGVEIAERYDLQNKPYRVAAVGASYDPGNWFAMGEYAIQTSDSWLGDRTGWYVSGGVRINQFTPYVIYSQVKPDSPSSDPGVPAVAATRLNAGLNALLRALANDQKTVAVGGRWDFARNAALKVQYDHIDIAPGSRGSLLNQQPGFVPGGKVDVFSVALDFVF
jgi:opacity protein-like surface antigen